MPKLISLRDFLLTGEFGGVREDPHPDELPGLLGEPSDRHNELTGVTYFLYGWYELAFWGTSLMYVRNDAMHAHYLDRSFQNDHVRIESWVFDRPTPLTRPEIVTALTEIDAVFRPLDYQGREAIQMDCGVLLDFNPSLENAQQIVCDSVSLTFPDFRRVPAVPG